MTIHTNPNGETSILPVSFADNLVRTGVIGDGNCMFHAILSSYSNKYIKLSDDEKVKYVERMRKMLPDIITKDIWLQIGYGETSRLEYSLILHTVLNMIYAYVLDNGGDSTELETNQEFKQLVDYIEKNKSVCEFICHKLPLKDLDRDILEQYKVDKDVYFDSTNFVKLVKKYFKNKFGKNLNENDEQRFNALLVKVLDFFDKITKTSIEAAYQHCRRQLGDNNVWIGTEYLSFISEIFSVNIYFIDASTLLPYVFGDDQLFQYKKSIILLWVDDSHFEIVGMIEDNSVRRTFNSEEDLIKMIHAYTVNPKKAMEKYPAAFKLL